MPSMRSPPSSPSASPSAESRIAWVQRKPAASQPKADPPRPDDTSASDEEELARGFYESSYELRTGMDLIESDWPDDTTLPGLMDED